MSRRTLNNEEASEYVRSLGYELLTEGYIKDKQKIILKDNFGYLYVSILNNLKTGYSPRFAHKSNPYTIQNIKLWCKLNNKPFELIEKQEYSRSDINLKWKCLKEDCGEIFESTWLCISASKGCPFCAGRKVGLSNCLAKTHPELSAEWHPTLNGDLTPYNVTHGSMIRAWWQCSKNPKHVWDTYITDRGSKNRGCPYCSGKLPSEDYNLLVTHPELCEEWDYDKNIKRPEEYTRGSTEEVYWKCKNFGHGWSARILNRAVSGNNCPICSESRGEKRIEEILHETNLIMCKDYIPQKTFDGLLGLGNRLLSFDFYLPNYNICIEYQGIQHYEPVEYFGGEKSFKQQKIHDKLKNDYCNKNNIKLLRIPYWDFDNIEEILEKELKLKKEVI